MRTKKILLATPLTALLVAGTASVPSPARAASPESAASSAQASALDAIEVRVNGLACPFCAYGLQKKLKALPGARDVKVDLEAGRASFEAPAGTLSKEQIKQAIKDAGFSPGSIKIARAG